MEITIDHLYFPGPFSLELNVMVLFGLVITWPNGSILKPLFLCCFLSESLGSHLLEVTITNNHHLIFKWSQIFFIKADVGGFFGNPEPDLLVRWYQTGSLQPFFRGHAHIDTKRREPWLFGEPYTSLIRESIHRRYRLLPYIYTLFWESNQNGKPIMRYEW